MTLLLLLAAGLIFFAACYLQESGLFRAKRTMRYDAQIIDEVEDEVYDNTGGTKTRFFKAYEFMEEGENKVVRSERPMKRITNTVGRKCVIYVDGKNRKAMEEKDVVRYRVYAVVLILFAIAAVATYICLPILVPGVAV